MSPRPVVSFDTTVINKLADDMDAACALIAELKSAYKVRLTATHVDEIIATTDAEKRARLLDVCREFLKGDNAEVILPFQEIIKNLVTRFEADGSLDWREIPLRLPEYEREIVLQDLINDKMAQEQREHQAGAMAEFENLLSGPRSAFEKLFGSRGESRPRSAAEFVSWLQVEGGAFWGIGRDFYGRLTKRAPSEERIRRFAEVCPPIRALLMAIFVSVYHLSVREVGKRHPEPQRNDMFMSVYLPYCDEFVSDDRDQQKCLAEVASLAGLNVRVCWFKEFRDSFKVSPPA